ncbi:recombinase family protein [Rhizobium sp. LjRoot254]
MIGYARVSTDDQNLALQQDALRAAACDRIFEDSGVSGTEWTRPGLDAALATLRAGDTLVVWRFDRLGRSLVQLVGLIEDLSERGIGVRSLTESFDASSSGGKLLFHLIAALAEFERTLIAERTRAGLAAARARGVKLGRPPRFNASERDEVLRSVRSGSPVKEVARAHGMHPRMVYRIVEAASE